MTGAKGSSPQTVADQVNREECPCNSITLKEQHNALKFLSVQ